MQRSLTTFISAFLLSAFSIPLAYGAQANHDALTFDSAESCLEEINTTVTEHQHRESLNGQEFTLLSWNIEKGRNSGWKEELRDLAEEVQLVLLQEAVFIEEMRDSANDAVFWSFSPGYKNKQYSSGIMTLSRVQPDMICSLQMIEPWLQTPKIASITRFPMEESEQDLLLVNIHQINFALGMKSFSQQLQDVSNILESHEGPIILSGDFNTWRKSRLNLLQEVTANLGLTPASFSPDYRKKMFGLHLDHIFTRGFNITESHTVQVDTSDHNPLIITLSLKEV